MSLVITCPDCGGSLQTPDDSVGKQVKCPKCSTIFAVAAPTVPMAIRNTASAAESAPPPRQRRAAPRPDDDDDDDYEPSPRRSRRQPAYDTAPPPSTGAQVGLGGASLALGAIGVLIGMIPCFGVFGLPVAIVGFLLGAIGLVVAFLNERHGLALPLAGTLLNLVGIGFVVTWFLIVGVWASETTKRGTAALDKFAKDLDRQMEAERQRQQKIIDDAKQRPGITEVAQRRVSVNNLKQLALAMQMYMDANNNMPAAGGRTGKLSWRVDVLPYLEEEQLYREFHLDEAWDSPHNKQLLTRMPKVFAPVRDTGAQPGYTYYQVFTGPNTPFVGNQGPRIANFADGTSNTFLIVEAGNPVPWTKPEDIRYDAQGQLPRLGGLFAEGFNAALADASVIFIRRQRVPDDTIRALITPAGGEPVNLPQD